MKRYFAVMALALGLVGCGGASNNSQSQQGDNTVAQGPVFAPEKKETVVTRRPASNPMEDVMRFQGAVRFMIVVPDGFDTKTAEILQDKLMAIASVNGVGALGGDPGLAMVPTLSLLSADVTSTVPAKHKVTYNFGVYVGNVVTGDIYGSVQQSIMGVGDSRELAMINAAQSIKPTDNLYQEMLKGAQEKVIEYLEANGETLLLQAQGYADAQQYAQALAVLNTIPSCCTELYAKAAELKNTILGRELVSRADELLAKMEAALGSARDDMAGHCAEAMSYYTMIPAGTPAKERADAVYAKYIESLDPDAELNWERECREWESAEKERERNHEFNMYKEEMAAKVAIDGQTALLAKYKLDESHNKRGKFWKFFYNREE